MYQENGIKDRAMKRIDLYPDIDENTNRKVIRGLSRMIVKIWCDWKEDTRHYQPSQKLHRSYLDTIDRGERLLDPKLSNYEEALEVVKESRKFIQLVVKYRTRAKIRVY